MPGLKVSAYGDALTATGGATGIVTVTSNSGFYAGAGAWIYKSDGSVSAEVTVVSLISTNQVQLKLKTAMATYPDLSGYPIGSRLDMPSQVVYIASSGGASVGDASSTSSGLVNTIAQSFAGLKTFIAGLALQAKLAITGISSGQNAIEVNTNSRIHMSGGTGGGYFFSDGTSIFSGASLVLTGAAGSLFLNGSIASNSLSTVAVKGAQVDGASAVGVASDTPAYSTAGAKIHSFRNNAVEKAFVDKDGNVATPNLAGPDGLARIGLPIAGASTILGRQVDGATAVGVILDTAAAYATGGAKILSFRTGGVEKSYIDATAGRFAGPVALTAALFDKTAPITTGTTLGNNISVHFCDATTASYTLTLPTAVGNTGLTFTFKKKDSTANTITLDGNASELIDGQLTYVLTAQYQRVKIISDGANWLILCAA